MDCSTLQEQMACYYAFSSCTLDCSSWWHTLTYTIDNCISSCNDQFPLCANHGSVMRFALHTTRHHRSRLRRRRGEDRKEHRRGSLQVRGGAGVTLYVAAETGYILAAGDGFGEYAVSDQTIADLTNSCLRTAALRALRSGGNGVGAVIVTGTVTVGIGYESYDCFNACVGDESVPNACRRANGSEQTRRSFLERSVWQKPLRLCTRNTEPSCPKARRAWRS